MKDPLYPCEAGRGSYKLTMMFRTKRDAEDFLRSAQKKGLICSGENDCDWISRATTRDYRAQDRAMRR